VLQCVAVCCSYHVSSWRIQEKSVVRCSELQCCSVFIPGKDHLEGGRGVEVFWKVWFQDVRVWRLIVSSFT